MRAVVIPWQSTDCEHRTRARGRVAAKALARGLTVAYGFHDEEPWCKARAVDHGVHGLPDDVDAVAILDADCIIPNLYEAFQVLDEGVPWVIPHTMVHRLTKDSTRAVLDGGPLQGVYEDHPYIGYPGGGCVVIRRETWDEVPMDPGFVGWGHEDKAWSYALTCLVGEPVRLDGTCWHLWHPPQPRLDRRVGSLESRALEWEYRAAKRDPERMRPLVEQAKKALHT